MLLTVLSDCMPLNSVGKKVPVFWGGVPAISFVFPNLHCFALLMVVSDHLPLSFLLLPISSRAANQSSSFLCYLSAETSL